jgi:hypothetical protein
MVNVSFADLAEKKKKKQKDTKTYINLRCYGKNRQLTLLETKRQSDMFM